MRVAQPLCLLVIVLAPAACFGGGDKATVTSRDATTGERAAWRIAYTSYIYGDREIYVMNADGSRRIPLTDNRASDDFPVWSPDGSKIAFVRTPESSVGDIEIYVVNADGGGEVRLTHGGAHGPAWSPDGSKIAFSCRGGEICVMDADGRGRVRLTETRKYASSGAPTWSPDGQKIAFGSDRDHFERSALYVMEADGSHETRLTHSENDESGPAWSPDGDRIAFARLEGKYGYAIHVINADGTGDTVLTGNTKTSNGALAWSPDGSQIAFIGERLSGGGGGLFVMDADGSDLRQLATYSFTADPPAWAPDGATVIFGRGYLELDERGYSYGDILAIDMASGRLTTLIPKKGEAYGPVVSPR